MQLPTATPAWKTANWQTLPCDIHCSPHLHVVKVLLDKGQVLGRNLLFQLLNLVGHDLELALHFTDLTLHIQQRVHRVPYQTRLLAELV